MTSTASELEATPAGADAAAIPLKSRVISGSIWTIGSYAAGQVLRLGGNLIFARLLFPQAFGLMALVSIFVQGLAMFSDIGIGPSIIQSRRGEEPRFLNTAWTIQVVRGFLLWIVSAIGARPFAALYGEPQLASLIPVAALGTIISSFNSTRLFTSGRKIALARIMVIDFSSQTVSLVAMLVWCFVTRGVWAIVFGGLFGTMLKMILSYTMLGGERNGFAFDREAFRELTHFGRWIFVSTALSFLTSQVDRLLLGKLETMGSLGVYSIAMNLASVPPMVAAALTGIVLFPMFAHHSRTDTREYERSIFSTRKIILEGALFLFSGLVLAAPAFIRLCYDQRYRDAMWMTQILTIPMWTQVLMLSADRAVLAAGDSRTLAISNGASVLAKMGACLAGFRIAGVTGFILGLAVGNLAGHVPIVIALARRGVHILRQDVAYTAVAVSVLGGTLMVQRFLVGASGGRLGAVVELAVAACAIVPLGLRLWKTGKTGLARR